MGHDKGKDIEPNWQGAWDQRGTCRVTKIVEMIEQLSRLTHSAGHDEGLYPIQWTALRFFSEAPAWLRTTVGFAQFQGMSVARVTRTVRILADKGLLARAANPLSRRTDLIALTHAGLTMMQRDPRLSLTESLERMPTEQKAALAAALETLLDRLFSMQLEANLAPDATVEGDMATMEAATEMADVDDITPT